LIASWYFDEWGYLGRHTDRNHIENRLQNALHRENVPLTVIAFDQDELVGVAQLKYREMDIYPEKDHWLGGVYVPAEHRGKGVATQLIRRALDIALSLGVVVLNLQTQRLDGGLYGRLGWVAVEQVTYKGIDVLVMEKRLEDG